MPYANSTLLFPMPAGLIAGTSFTFMFVTVDPGGSSTFCGGGDVDKDGNTESCGEMCPPCMSGEMDDGLRAVAPLGFGLG
jgi:hypothetical protein